MSYGERLRLMRRAITRTTSELVIRGSCHHDCPDTCVWDVTVVDGTAVRIRGNPDHPTTQGQLCPKVNRLLDRVYHPDRLATPLRRTGPKGSGEYEPVTWDTALGEIADRLGGLVANAGGESILQYSFDGTQGVVQKGIMADRFFNSIGASDTRRHLCGVTAWLGAADVSGIPFGIDPEDLVRSKSIILWGTNTYLTNRHLWPFIEQAREAGATVTVIDPIKTSTADKADEFLQIRPGTDVALVLAMVHVMARDGLLDIEWINGHTLGWEDLEKSAAEMSPETTADITGIAEDRIEALAHAYVTNRPSAIRVLIGPEHREHGRDIMRAVALLPSLTGAWRDSGGGLARSTQVYFEEALSYPDEPDPPRRQFNMARLGQVLTDANLTPPIEALVVHNSNPAVICPDQNAVLRGLERDDLFTVVIEQFMTDTARYADIILPATTQIEHLDLGVAWGHLYLSLNQPAIKPVGGALPNTEIFRRLASALNLDNPEFRDTDEDLIRQLLESDHPWLEGITFESLSTQTWQRLNVDPGHRPYVDSLADTPDGRLHLGNLTYRRGTETPGGAEDGDYPLALISRKQHLKFLNANYGGFDKHLPSGGEPLLQIHATDAQNRGVSSGDRVQVFNDRGTLTLTAEVSTDVQPGVIAIPFGWWHRHTPEQRGVNALTNPSPPIDDLGSAAFHDTLVQVKRQ